MSRAASSSAARTRAAWRRSRPVTVDLRDARRASESRSHRNHRAEDDERRRAAASDGAAAGAGRMLRSFGARGPASLRWQPAPVPRQDDPITLRPRHVGLPAVGPAPASATAAIAIVALAPRPRRPRPALAGLIVALHGVGVLVFDIPAGWALTRSASAATIGAASITVILHARRWTLTTSEVVFAALAFVQGCGWSAWQLARLAYVARSCPRRCAAGAMSLLGGTEPPGHVPRAVRGGARHALRRVRRRLRRRDRPRGRRRVVLFATVSAGRDDESRGNPVPVGGSLRDHRHVFLTAGLAATSLQALRQARDVLLPLWADSIGLSVQTTAVLFGVSLGVELLMVYPGGSVIDRWPGARPSRSRAWCHAIGWRSCRSPTAR